MPVVFREAVFADLAAIGALAGPLNRLHHDAWPHIFAAEGDPARDEAHWRQSVGTASATTFLAEDASVLVAFVTVYFRDESHTFLQPLRYARIGSIVVAETHRHQGIAKRLMERAEAWATARGAHEVRLTVWAFNEAARGLYAELGYDVRSFEMGKALPTGVAPFPGATS